MSDFWKQSSCSRDSAATFRHRLDPWDSRERCLKTSDGDWGRGTASVVPLVSYSGPDLCARARFIAGYQEACCGATRCGTPLELGWLLERRGAARASAPFRAAHWMFIAAAGRRFLTHRPVCCCPGECKDIYVYLLFETDSLFRLKEALFISSA